MLEEAPQVGRPTSVLVLAISNLLVGALLVSSGECCGSWQVFLDDQYFIGGVYHEMAAVPRPHGLG